MRSHNAVPVAKRKTVRASLYNHIASVPNFDLMITPESDIQVEFDYPLDKPVRFDFHHDGGFTLKDVLIAVRDGYYRIYDESEKYGWWAHELSDLFLESVEAATPTLIVLSVDAGADVVEELTDAKA